MQSAKCSAHTSDTDEVPQPHVELSFWRRLGPVLHHQLYDNVKDWGGWGNLGVGRGWKTGRDWTHQTTHLCTRAITRGKFNPTYVCMYWKLQFQSKACTYVHTNIGNENKNINLHTYVVQRHLENLNGYCWFKIFVYLSLFVNRHKIAFEITKSNKTFIIE